MSAKHDVTVSVRLDERNRGLVEQWFRLTVFLDDAQYNADAVRVPSGAISVYRVWRNGTSRQTSRSSETRRIVEDAVRSFVKGLT